MPLRVPAPPHALLRCTATWNVHDAPTCDHEGGCSDGDLVVPVHHSPDGPPRSGSVAASIDVGQLPGSATRWRLTVLPR